ncbi:MAG: HigA family addiction module antitoxin [Treponema sp.]|nr:HigA family addiction module antitoxin [Treponema sp.]
MPKSNKTPAAVLNALMGEYQLNPFSLSKAISLSNSAILQILKGKGKITVPTALRLAKFFGQTAAFWLDLQREVDLEEAEKSKELANVLKGISKVVKPKDKPKAAPKAKAAPKGAKAKPAGKAKKSLADKRKPAKAKAPAKPKAAKKKPAKAPKKAKPE